MTGDRPTARPTSIARRTSYQPYEARWLLGPLLATFALALGLIAVSQTIAFFVWVAGSVVTIGIGRWHEARYDQLHPRAALPSATSIPRHDRSRRS